MAADKGKPGKTQGSGQQGSGSYSGSARKPVTIDLEASEVKKAASEAKENSKKGDEKSSRGTSPSPEAKAGTSQSGPSQTASTSAGKPGTGPAAGGKAPDAKSDTAKEEAKASETKGTASPASASAMGAGTQTTSAGKDTPRSAAGDKAEKPADAKSAESKTATSSAKAEAKPAAETGAKAGVTGTAKTDEKAKGASAAPTPSSPKTDQKAEQKEGPGFGRLIAAGVIGAVLVAGGGYALDRAGVLTPSGQGTPEDMRAALEAAQTRVETLENRIAELAQSATSGNESGEVVNALQDRISALEESVATAGSQASQAVSGEIEGLKSGLAELRRFVSSGSAGESAGLAALEKRQQETAAAQADISSRLDAVASELEPLKALPAQIEAIGASVDEQAATIASLSQTLNTASDTSKQAIAAVQESVAGLQSDIAEVKARLEPVESRLGDATARETAARAVAVSSLSAAVDEGRSYETQLAAVKGVLPADADLSALEEHAAGGIPTRASLTAQFPAVARAMTAALDQPQGDDLVDSFLANARSLVSVRTPGESDGATPSAALGRMEARVQAGDFKGAIEAYGELPEQVQAAGADWVTSAKARVAADELVAKVTDSVLKELAKSGS